MFDIVKKAARARKRYFQVKQTTHEFWNFGTTLYFKSNKLEQVSILLNFETNI